MIIRFPDGQSTELRRVRVNGLPGLGSYTLALAFELSVRPPSVPTRLEQMSLRLDWGDDGQRMIGLAIPETAQPIQLYEHSNDLTITFRIVLSPQQLEAIGAQRAGGDFQLSAWLVGQVIQNGKTSTIQTGEKFPVRQQEWVDALERMGYRAALLYEISLPSNDGPAHQGTAAEIIRRAQQYLNKGDYGACVGQCRYLFEVFQLGDEQGKVTKSARDKYRAGNAKEMNLPERVALLRDALRHTTHLAQHHSPDDEYSRDQARAILGMTVMICGLSQSEHVYAG